MFKPRCQKCFLLAGHCDCKDGYHRLAPKELSFLASLKRNRSVPVQYKASNNNQDIESLERKLHSVNVQNTDLAMTLSKVMKTHEQYKNEMSAMRKELEEVKKVENQMAKGIMKRGKRHCEDQIAETRQRDSYSLKMQQKRQSMSSKDYRPPQKKREYRIKHHSSQYRKKQESDTKGLREMKERLKEVLEQGRCQRCPLNEGSEPDEKGTFDTALNDVQVSPRGCEHGANRMEYLDKRYGWKHKRLDLDEYLSDERYSKHKKHSSKGHDARKRMKSKKRRNEKVVNKVEDDRASKYRGKHWTKRDGPEKSRNRHCDIFTSTENPDKFVEDLEKELEMRMKENDDLVVTMRETQKELKEAKKFAKQRLDRKSKLKRKEQEERFEDGLKFVSFSGPHELQKHQIRHHQNEHIEFLQKHLNISMKRNVDLAETIDEITEDLRGIKQLQSCTPCKEIRKVDYERPQKVKSRSRRRANKSRCQLVREKLDEDYERVHSNVEQQDHTPNGELVSWKEPVTNYLKMKGIPKADVIVKKLETLRNLEKEIGKYNFLSTDDVLNLTCDMPCY